MHDLTITPQGHLLVREVPLETSNHKLSKGLLEAYRRVRPRDALLRERRDGRVLPPSFEFARSIARLYLTALCKAATAEPGGAVPALPPAADLDRPFSRPRP